MLEKARVGFEHLQRLANPALNLGLLANLRERGLEDEAPLAAANLLRRAGDLAGARAVFTRIAGEMDDWSCIPAGQFSDGQLPLAPLVVIDDLLPPERMAALYDHACDRQAEFRHALATNDGADPSYDPERRQTLLDFRFTLEREFFDLFIDENLGRLQQCLGLPPFTIDRREMKLSNHVEGGFFKAHADNHAPYGEAGRGITWLYYFAGEDIRYIGGDLLLLDSRPATEDISQAWFTRIEPRPNRFVAFPSWFYHAVTPVSLPEGAGFPDGRFAVSGHLRKHHDHGIAWWDRS